MVLMMKHRCIIKVYHGQYCPNEDSITTIEVTNTQEAEKEFIPDLIKPFLMNCNHIEIYFEEIENEDE